MRLSALSQDNTQSLYGVVYNPNTRRWRVFLTNEKIGGNNMQLKKLVAGAMGLLMAGSTLAFAAGLDDLPQPFVAEDGQVDSLMVVGADAKPSDVVGAIDIAGRLGSQNTQAVSVGGAVGAFSVSGDGVALDTSNTQLYFGDQMDKARQTLTENELDLLASGDVSISGTEYGYSQYIDMGTTATSVGNSDNDLDDAQLLVEVNDDKSTPLYSYKVTFDQAINATAAAEDTDKITILGTEYTFTDSSNTDNQTVYLFGSSNTELLTGGETVTVTVGGTDYEITVNGVSDSETAVITVDGTTKEISDTGSTSYTIAGLDLNVQGIFYYGENSQGQIQLAMGSNKMKLENGKEVEIGDDKVQNTNVSVVASGDKISEIKIDVAAQDDDDDHVLAGESFDDPVFGSLNFHFAGLNPAEMSDARSEIEIKSDGSDMDSVTFTAWTGDETTIEFAKDPDTSGSGDSMAFTDSNDNAIHIVEGESVGTDEYVILDQGGFTRMLQVTDVDDLGTEDSVVSVSDIITGQDYDISLGTDDQTTYYFDGQKYYVSASGTSAVFTYGNGASVGSLGDEITVFPRLIDKNGASVVLTDVSQSVASTADVILPSGSDKTAGAEVTVTDGNPINVTYSGTTKSLNTSSGSAVLTVDGTVYNITGDEGANTVTFSVQDQVEPGVLLIEEQNDAAEYNSILVESGDDSDSITVAAPTFSANAGDGSGSLDNDDKIYLDEYGTYIEHDADDKESLKAYYPDGQATVEAFMLAESASVSKSEGTASQTVDKAVALTTTLGKLDTEVTSSDKATSNLILVGGPAVNDLVSELAAANKTEGTDWYVSEGAGTALIDYVGDAWGEGTAALVVAGHSASDTRKAAEVVQNYDSYSSDLTGEEAVLKVSDGSVSFQ